MLEDLVFNTDSIATYVKGVYILLGQKAIDMLFKVGKGIIFIWLIKSLNSKIKFPSSNKLDKIRFQNGLKFEDDRYLADYLSIGVSIVSTDEKLCYYSKCPNFVYYSGLSIGILIIHFYLAKISWSFNTRLQRGQELLVIHGKYLEQMISNENQKIIDTQNLIIQSKYSEIELSNNKQSNIIPSNNGDNK